MNHGIVFRTVLHVSIPCGHAAYLDRGRPRGLDDVQAYQVDEQPQRCRQEEQRQVLEDDPQRSVPGHEGVLHRHGHGAKTHYRGRADELQRLHRVERVTHEEDLSRGTRRDGMGGLWESGTQRRGEYSSRSNEVLSVVSQPLYFGYIPSVHQSLQACGVLSVSLTCISTSLTDSHRNTPPMQIMPIADRLTCVRIECTKT